MMRYTRWVALVVAWGGLAASVSAEAAPGAAAPASASNTVPCWAEGGTVLAFKPRRCVLGGPHGSEQVDLVRTRWRSWQGASAYARATSRANMGMRARVRVRIKLYRRRHLDENTFRFTRARFNFDRQGWGSPVVLRYSQPLPD